MPFSAYNSRFYITASFIDYATGEEQDFGRCINAIAIKKDYVNNIFPLFVLNLRVTVAQQKYIAKNKFYISLQIYRCPIEADTEMNNDVGSSSPTTDKLMTNIILRPFDPSKMFAEIKSNEVANDDSNIEQQLVSCTISCIPKEQLKTNNTLINNCYQNANLNEIAINCLSESYSGDIYFQESYNTERFASLLIPPMSLVDSLRYIHDNYMLYRQNLNIFFDNNILFVYDILEQDRQFNNNLFIEITQTQDSVNQNKYMNNYLDENDNITKYIDNNPLFTSISDKNYYNLGEKIQYSSYDEKYNLVNRSYSLNQQNNDADKKERMLWNSLMGKDYETRSLTEVDKFCQLTFKNIDPSLITPSTKINISGSSNEDVSGNYILLSSEIFYTSSDYITFSNAMNINLAKI